MKTFFIAAFMLVTLGSAIAAPFTPPVTTKVLSHFSENYSNAVNVKWTLASSYTKATFTQNNKKWEVFYDNEGNLYGTSRNISFSELPAKASGYINKKYSDYGILETVEFDSESDGKLFFVSLQQGKKKVILQVDANSWVSVFKRSRV
ncbi:hypothetical protein [Filimonas effusa]|uniref:Beta-lactamase-inhibitor-like PepSY-like domain-containing protein n=1 Tax=Filimonas effusa TaxID=2508721 RepID=A0A4Q1CZT9_9BACT|nr:hypothetical protein [Filimonas effusa]RXK80927.1 hypothetical protein ESB13_22495 [Filimonas effusa]